MISRVYHLNYVFITGFKTIVIPENSSPVHAKNINNAITIQSEGISNHIILSVDSMANYPKFSSIKVSINLKTYLFLSFYCKETAYVSISDGSYRKI